MSRLPISNPLCTNSLTDQYRPLHAGQLRGCLQTYSAFPARRLMNRKQEWMKKLAAYAVCVLVGERLCDVLSGFPLLYGFRGGR
jgi:hypothetical protein